MTILRFSILLIATICIIDYKCIADDKLLFSPLKANIYESRLGSVFTDNNEKLRLDIGGNYDFYTNFNNPKFLWALGSEFFTYTRLRSEGNFKFPVETTDFYFGINGTAKFEVENIPIHSRLRVAHISTHLSDGYSKDGVFFVQPFVYSKEFIDICASTNYWDFRPYLGAIFIFSYIPKDLNLIIPQLGFEYSHTIFNKIELVAAYDLKIDGYKNLETNQIVYKPMNMIVAGVIYRTDKNRGIFIKLERFFGKNYYGQFYKVNDNYFGLGFELIYH